MLVLNPRLDLVPSRGFDLVHYVLNKSGPKLGIGPGPMYNIGPGPMCHMGLAYNRQVCPAVCDDVICEQP